MPKAEQRWPHAMPSTITREFNAWWKQNYPRGPEFRNLRKQLRRGFEAGYKNGYGQCKVDYKGN